MKYYNTPYNPLVDHYNKELKSLLYNVKNISMSNLSIAQIQLPNP